MTIALTYLAPRVAGFNVIDCEVRDRNVLYLLAREDYTHRPNWRDSMDPPPEGKLAKRVIGLRLDSPEEKKWGHAHLTSLDLSYFSMAFAPEPKIVVVDMGSKAWAQSADNNGFETAIKSRAEGGVNRGAITRAKCFGQHQMVCNTARQVFTRIRPGHWELLGPPMAKITGTFTGFEDFDRFHEGDLYAAGGEGDLWHFNGELWRQCAFPTNWGLSAVCCAGDGQVYVAASVVIYRGQGDRWTRLKTRTAKMSIPIKDLVWYEDKLWGTSDYGVWTLEDDTLVEADLPSEIKVCAGNLAVRDGVMLLAGYGGAAFKRDGEWTVIFHDHDIRALAAKTK